MDFLSSMTETESMAETREVDTTILSLVPVIGDAIEVAEIVKGVDLGTGEKLGMGARATALVLVLFPGNIRAGWKAVKGNAKLHPEWPHEHGTR